MEIERETLVEVVVSFVSVGGFIAGVLFVGQSYGEGGLNQQGALVLVGLIVAFILVMTVAGYWLSAREA
jgi:hypothetical protein